MNPNRKQQVYTNIGGLNLYTNPLLSQSDGQVIRAVNVDSFPYGALIKRPGYGTYAAGSLPSGITNFFSWKKDSGTQMYVYAAAGSLLYYSLQGTGAWTQAANGTITPGSYVGNSVLNNVLITSQNAGTTRHTTDGISFTDTTLAPAGEDLEQYQNRIYIGGTGNNLTYSTANDATNWNTSGTSDSSSLTIPGGGNINKLFKLSDRLYVSKNSRSLLRWDGYSLVDTASNLGLSSPYSYGSIQNTGFWLNQMGIFESAGDSPTLISNPIDRFINNTNGSAIAGTSFKSAPATTYQYSYFLAAGSMTDDLTNETVSNAIIKYDVRKNMFFNWQFNNFPTAMHSYIDTSGTEQFIFGDSTGQTYQLNQTTTNDNGQPIETIIELCFHFGAPHLEKDWRIWWGFFNPGCQAQIAVATSNTFIKEEKNWKVIGGAQEGVVLYRFPPQDRSRYLYVKIIDSSRNTRLNYYGCAIDAMIVATQ